MRQRLPPDYRYIIGNVIYDIYVIAISKCDNAQRVISDRDRSDDRMI